MWYIFINMRMLLRLRYWLIGAITFIIGVLFVAHEQHRATEKYKAHRAEYCATLSASTEQKKACEEEGASAKDYLPWWYVLVAWPDGIAAWGLLLTLGAIAWQAVETRRAAGASADSAKAALEQAKIARQALRLQFRPKLGVRSISLEESENSFHVKVVIANRGGLPAYIHGGDITLSWLYKHPSKMDIKPMILGSSTVQPGSQNSFGMSMRDNDMLRYKHYLTEATKRPEHNPIIRLRCEGTLSYFDDSNAYRYIGFSRIHDVETGQWTPSTDTSREYDE